MAYSGPRQKTLRGLWKGSGYVGSASLQPTRFNPLSNSNLSISALRLPRGPPTGAYLNASEAWRIVKTGTPFEVLRKTILLLLIMRLHIFVKHTKEELKHVRDSQLYFIRMLALEWSCGCHLWVEFTSAQWVYM